jgi:hypothetical protein
MWLGYLGVAIVVCTFKQFGEKAVAAAVALAQVSVYDELGVIRRHWWTMSISWSTPST